MLITMLLYIFVTTFFSKEKKPAIYYYTFVCEI
jgi:hypothetical protein